MQRTLTASDPNWQRLFADEQWRTLAEEWGRSSRQADLLQQMLALMAAHGLLGAISEQDDGGPEAQRILHPDDVKILEALARAKTSVLQYHLEKDPNVGLSRRTISDRLGRLREAGLTHRPNGERGGEAITEAGRRWLHSNSERFLGSGAH